MESRTCFPRALNIPPVHVASPSNTWNKATHGRICATNATTSTYTIPQLAIRLKKGGGGRRGESVPGSSLKICAHEFRKIRNMALYTPTPSRQIFEIFDGKERTLRMIYSRSNGCESESDDKGHIRCHPCSRRISLSQQISNSIIQLR